MMDKKDFLKLIEDMEINEINNFNLDITLDDGTKIVLKNND